MSEVPDVGGRRLGAPGALSGFVPRLIALQRSRLLGPLAKQLLLALRGLEFPASVEYGSELQFKHGGSGVVVHPLTVIGDRVTIYHRVTIGQSNPEGEQFAFGGVTIEDDVILAAGCFVARGRRAIGRPSWHRGRCRSRAAHVDRRGRGVGRGAGSTCRLQRHAAEPDHRVRAALETDGSSRIDGSGPSTRLGAPADAGSLTCWLTKVLSLCIGRGTRAAQVSLMCAS